MNFVKLVESGNYRKEDLSEKGQAIIQGMEMALDHIETSEFYKTQVDELGENRLINKMIEEIQDYTVSKVIQELYINICETIVAIADKEATERE